MPAWPATQQQPAMPDLGAGRAVAMRGAYLGRRCLAALGLRSGFATCRGSRLVLNGHEPGVYHCSPKKANMPQADSAQGGLQISGWIHRLMFGHQSPGDGSPEYGATPAERTCQARFRGRCSVARALHARAQGEAGDSTKRKPVSLLRTPVSHTSQRKGGPPHTHRFSGFPSCGVCVHSQ